jgi:hypothetical protein
MLGRLTDPRSPQGKRHELVFTLAAAVVAVLAGACNYRQIASEVADLPQSLLAKLGARWSWFQWRYQWPSEATLRRVLQRVDATELDLLIGSWLFERAHRDTEGLLVIALDGKVLRGAWTDDNDQVTLFSAMIHDVGVTVAQIRVPEGTHEITQVDTLLAGISEVTTSTRVILTVDAAHTQRATAEHVRARGFDYIMTIKGNQPTLQTTVAGRCRPLVATTPAHTVEERAHGRINRWSTWMTEATGIDFPHAAQLGCIRRDEFALDGTALSKEFALIITSPPPNTPALPTCTPTYANTGESRTKATTFETPPGERTTTKPGSETDHTPWQHCATSHSDSSASMACTKSKKRPKRSIATATAPSPSWLPNVTTLHRPRS